MGQLQMGNKSVHFQAVAVHQYKFLILCGIVTALLQFPVNHCHSDRFVFVSAKDSAVSAGKL